MIADTYTKPNAHRTGSLTSWPRLDGSSPNLDPRKPAPGKDRGTRDAIYTFVQAYIAKNDVPPTMREIGEAVGLRSANSVSYHLNQLVNATLFEKRAKGKCGTHHLYLPIKSAE